MLEQAKFAYIQYRWTKMIAFVMVVISGGLLYWLTGGFPPWAWRFLFSVIPQLPSLWAAHGSSILTPLSGLLLLAISLLIMWAIIVIAAIKVGSHCWHDIRAHRDNHTERDAGQSAEYAIEQSAPLARIEPQQMYGRVRAALDSYPGAQRIALHTWSDSAPMSAAVPEQPISSVPRKVECRSNRSPSHASVIRQRLQIVSSSKQELLAEDEFFEEAPREDVESSISTAYFDIAHCNTVPGQDDEQELDGYDEQDTLPTYEEEEDYAECDTFPAYEEEKEIAECATLPGKDGELEGGCSEGCERLIYHPDNNDTIPMTPELDGLVSHQQTVRLVVGVGLDPGTLRKDAPNEDTLLAIQSHRTTDTGTVPVGIFAVADGMGGHARGQDASRLAIQALSDVVVPVLTRDVHCIGDLAELLRDGVHRANLAIYQLNRQQQDMMGTTLTAALIINETAYVVNVGDSRTYLYRSHTGLQAITRDHSVVARLVEDGTITQDEIYTHPNRNQIYRCLGDHVTVETDTFVVPLQVNDVLLLCSDGLWEMVRDEEIQSIIATSFPHPSRISTSLVQAALSHGGADNVSAVVVYLAPETG